MEIITLDKQEQSEMVADLLDIPKQDNLDTYTAEIIACGCEKKMLFALREAQTRAQRFADEIADYLANNEE